MSRTPSFRNEDRRESSLVHMKPLLMAVALAMVTFAPAQDDRPLFVTFQCHNMEVREALKGIFRSLEDVGFSLEDGIRGRISVKLRDLPFETALQAICKSCWLTYRRQGNIYTIIKRERNKEEQTWLDAHPESMIDLRGAPKDLAPKFQAKKEKAADLLWRILKKTGQPFVIGTGLDKAISADFPAQPIGETLASIARTCGATLSHSHGAWIFAGPYPWPIDSIDGRPPFVRR